MSDDYHDDDSQSGGLWDPDVVSPPPAPRRPTLHAVPQTESHEFETGSVADVEPEEERLVRLDEFRSVSREEDDLVDRTRRPTWRRILPAAAALVGLIAIAATGLRALGSDDGNPTKPPALSANPADVEQAALTRAVKSASSHARGHAESQQHATRRSTRARRTATTRRGETDAAAPPQKSTQATTLVSQPASSPTATAGVGASSSSGSTRAQRATASCEFPPC
jgi:hypothetical protein